MWFCWTVCNQKFFVLYGVALVIFNLHLGVSRSVLCQMEGVGHMFSIHHISTALATTCTFWTFQEPITLTFPNKILNTTTTLWFSQYFLKSFSCRSNTISPPPPISLSGSGFLNQFSKNRESAGDQLSTVTQWIIQTSVAWPGGSRVCTR